MQRKETGKSQILDYNGTKVYLKKESYRNNGTLAVSMVDADTEEDFGMVTVNLCDCMQSDFTAYVDENNMPGILGWLLENCLAAPMFVSCRSGFCEYPLASFNF